MLIARSADMSQRQPSRWKLMKGVHIRVKYPDVTISRPSEYPRASLRKLVLARGDLVPLVVGGVRCVGGTLVEQGRRRAQGALSYAPSPP